MRKFLLLTAAMLFSWGAFSQALYSDDFESYTTGGYLAVQNGTWWTTWSNAPGTGEDALISEDFASSGIKSAMIDETGGATDLISKLGDKVSGKYEVDFDMYVGTGFCGYYNFQHFQAPGTEWAFEIYFRENGDGMLLAGSSTALTFTYPKDTWFTVSHIIDLDNDWIQYYVDGTMISEWPFHWQAGDTTGTLQLGGIDLFAGAYTGTTETPKFYIDNFNYEALPVDLYADDFESYTLDGYLAVQNPDWWTTWSNAPGTGEDALIKNDFSNSPSQSFLVDETDGATDLILKLGNKVSGAYDLSWYMYIETGYCGYYNIQHFQAPGTEWASELYFRESGAGELYVGSATPLAFSYPKDTWFQVEQMIDIDNDMTELYIDGVLINTWPFHYQAGDTTGTNQLGGVDFFAGALTGTTETPKAYFDDVSFIQTAGNQDPIIAVTPDMLEATADAGSSTTEMMNIANTGAASLDYQIDVIYNMPGVVKNNAVSISSNPNTTRSLSYVTSADPTPKPAANNPVPDDYVLHYDGDNSSAIGWASTPITIKVAARFPTNLTLPHAGMMLSSVDLYVNDMGADFSILIYDMGTSYAPGDLLYSQAFSPISLSWNTVTLDSPVYISGADIWVAYQFTQNVDSTYVPGCDAGPVNLNGDFLSTGVGWSHLSDNPDLPYNWNIRANLTGSPMAQWLSVDAPSGSITPGDAQDITVNFDAANLTQGTYYATLRITSNDPETPTTDIPVTFNVNPGGGMTSVVLDFESQDDFSLTFDPWTALDVDGSNTYGIQDYTFLHSGEPMAFIAFNPASVTPPMTGDPAIQPHGGVRFGACFAATTPPNDDWMISPQTTLGTNSALNMWVKSYTDQYGLEQYNVGVSTTGMDPADFTIISGSTPLQAPVDAWTLMNFDLSAYDGQTVYVGIQCVSNDAFIFMLDDVSIDFLTGVPEAPAKENHVNIYPNPATNFIHINSTSQINEIEVYNYTGQKVFSSVVKDKQFNMNTTGMTTGMYFIKIKSADGITTKKVLIK
jgi:hypothetical protein